MNMRQDRLIELRQALSQQLHDSQALWWRQAQATLAQQPDATTAALLSSQCKRHLTAPVVDLARALLLAQVLETAAIAEHLPLLRQWFLWGDDQEKIALLGALDWLDSSGQCLALALQAGRTSNPQVFAALALDNAYPSRHYPERAFHQLVLKALGMGLDVGRVIGLKQRHSTTFNQLALDLMQEQQAAGRPISPGLPEVIAFHLLDPEQRRHLPPQWHLYLN
ncbi:EboA domain-containing protein [Pseudomonas palleroniana]